MHVLNSYKKKKLPQDLTDRRVVNQLQALSAEVGISLKLCLDACAGKGSKIDGKMLAWQLAKMQWFATCSRVQTRGEFLLQLSFSCAAAIFF